MEKTHYNSHWLAETERLGLSTPGFPIKVPTFYGQCAEDYLCLSLLRSLATREGLDLTQETYAEIGAYHPVAGSSTYLLNHGLGMTGVLVEANPELLPELRRHRPHDRVLHLCITPEPQEFATLHVAPQGELSSIDPGFLGRFTGSPDEVAVEEITVPAITLSALMAREFSKAPLVLSIDLEGIDKDVIESYDFIKRPYLIQIESSEDHDRGAFRAIERTLAKQDYLIIARTDVNQLAVDMRRLAGAGRDRSLPLRKEGLDHLLEQVQVLTLDVFDTILARRAVKPTDVFRWLEVSEGWTGFAKARVAAEVAARKRHAERGQEVSLEEIYEVLASEIFLPQDAMAKELAAEGRFLYPNPTVVELISRARLAGRRVVAISDIYLSSSQVDALLRASGVCVDRVYTSSDHRHANLGKYNGRLFSHVLTAEGVPHGGALHVGDNLVADVRNARQAGLCAMETRQLHLLHSENDVHAEALRPFVKNAASSLVLGQYTRWLTHAGASRSLAETFGYAYGGPLLVGFAQYLAAKAKAAGIQRMLLLERDGNILAATFKSLGIAGLEIRTVPASRRMMVFPALDGNDPSRIKSLFAGQGEITESDFFDILALTLPDRAMDDQRKMSWESHLKQHETFIRERAAEEKALIIESLAEERALIAAGHKVAWVDVGWALTSISGLNEILGFSIPAFCIGSHERVSADLPHEGYLFTKGLPANVKEPIMAAPELIELIFSTPTCSTTRLARIDGRIVPVTRTKSRAECVRDGYIVEVWKGALAFVGDFRDLLPGVADDDLRQHNVRALTALCRAPLPKQYDMLGRIPHDRLVGGHTWKLIQDFWKPSALSTNTESQQASRVADLQYKLMMARRYPHRTVGELFSYLVFKYLARLSPLFPKHVTTRFAQSASKRNPRRKTD